MSALGSRPEGPPPPADWDRLLPPEEDGEPVTAQAPAPTRVGGRPGPLVRAAASWADAVAVVVVCTAAVGGVTAAGFHPSLVVLPWAVAAGGVWWVVTTAVTVVVRRATPGMALAGVRFAQPVAPARLVWVILASVLASGTLGLAALPGGGTGNLLARAGGSPLSEGQER